MGIYSQAAVAILREHRHKPITGTILSIGRQTFFLSPEEAVALVECELGIKADKAAVRALDTKTRGASRGQFISDEAFYSLFCDAQYRCLDITDYEGADFIFDLCQPFPKNHSETFDFILDGSTLDNVLTQQQQCAIWPSL